MAGRVTKRIQESRSVRYGSITIPFTLIKSNRRTYAISVDKEGAVTVRVPLAASERYISQMLTERQAWIEEHYSEAKRKASERENSSLTQEQKKALDARYRQAAKEYIPKRVAYFAQFTGGSYKRISIREQKTRWGSCSSKGTLSFHWKLMLAPPAVLDYVVVHELCHLKHMNHSREFWQAVERIMPDYKVHRSWLKEHGDELGTYQQL